MHSIAHIINPFNASQESDLYTAQPITFESIKNAKKNAEDIVNIELWSAHFKEDEQTVPDFFNKTYHLTRSVLDTKTFETKIKLPFIADILQRVYDESEAEYIIYTNVDIGLYPNFYLEVNKIINEGHDAFIINRRRLKPYYTSVNDLERIYLDKGKSHPGFDCFVFHRHLFPKLVLNGICVGVPFIEISFAHNLFAFSQQFKLFENEFLTFHIGEEIFKKRAPKEYYTYHKQQFWEIAQKIKPHLNPKKIPYGHYPLLLRLLKWGLHPCFPIRLMFQLELKNLFSK
jgi:hypothetical protein